MVRKTILCSAACLLLASTGRTEHDNTKSTLDSLISAALERNPTLQVAAHRRDQAEFQAAFAGQLPDTKLSVALLNVPRTSLALDESPMSGVVVGLAQHVPWPGQQAARSDLARLGFDRRVQTLAAAENRIARLVTQAYYDYAYWQLVAGMLEKNIELAGDITAVAETRYANGLGSLQDVLRTQTARARLENRLLQASQGRASALLSLAQLTDDPSTVNAPLDGELPPLANQDIIRPAEYSNPMITGASIGVAAAKRAIDLARSERWPGLTFGIDYRMRKDMPMDGLRGEDFLSFKVGLSLPLWPFSGRSNQISAARESHLAAQAQERAIVNDVERQVADLALALQSIKARVTQYAREILPQARAAADAAEVAYEVGRLDFNGYLTAQLDILNVELEKLALLRQYHLKRADLDELVRKPKESMK